jgi:hypothetical protein
MGGGGECSNLIEKINFAMWVLPALYDNYVLLRFLLNEIKITSALTEPETA